MKEPSAIGSEKISCNHKKVHLKSLGICWHTDGNTVTITHYWWCEDCEIDFIKEQTMTDAECAKVYRGKRPRLKP